MEINNHEKIRKTNQYRVNTILKAISYVSEENHNKINEMIQRKSSIQWTYQARSNSFGHFFL